MDFSVPGEFEVQLAFCVTFSALFIVFMPLYILRRDREPIKSRGWELSAVQFTVSQVDMVLRTLGTAYHINCGFEQVRVLTLLGVWAGPYIIRAFILW